MAEHHSIPMSQRLLGKGSSPTEGDDLADIDSVVADEHAAVSPNGDFDFSAVLPKIASDEQSQDEAAPSALSGVAADMGEEPPAADDAASPEARAMIDTLLPEPARPIGALEITTSPALARYDAEVLKQIRDDIAARKHTIDLEAPLLILKTAGGHQTAEEIAAALSFTLSDHNVTRQFSVEDVAAALAPALDQGAVLAVGADGYLRSPFHGGSCRDRIIQELMAPAASGPATDWRKDQIVIDVVLEDVGLSRENDVGEALAQQINREIVDLIADGEIAVRTLSGARYIRWEPDYLLVDRIGGELCDAKTGEVIHGG